MWARERICDILYFSEGVSESWERFLLLVGREGSELRTERTIVNERKNGVNEDNGALVTFYMDKRGAQRAMELFVLMGVRDPYPHIESHCIQAWTHNRLWKLCHYGSSCLDLCMSLICQQTQRGHLTDKPFVE
jgi:hypothetical protein